MHPLNNNLHPFRFTTRPDSSESWFKNPAVDAVTGKKNQKQIKTDDQTPFFPIEQKKGDQKTIKRDPKIFIPEQWQDMIKKHIGRLIIDPLK